ncbi:pyruvate/2-oxoglutarate dehydrogenase complex dihydrolipoamide dehydrogenase (E3) component [Hypnocyclicus thermotrophus]|uniref:Pyruvate/2-oxoglutarate dehydrogenase complex dihydrolipoamide dehydrogenase (E3) component n=1 Tax=Hypnocyclicus thermotrophus TaxID=1627895 RepID=A0AA46E1A2_9FUSO|nr:NAD(P)/FAD-dependent oxidoreductase [Hypnocyclicus thermotrophus]TDT72602.1 pyruvate/2-oxoglutarate dehydrogenase complex dihydrolipoamide dehydrogenase (E3) component [Hypnocyclicus thermotrophus]
MYDVIIIGSGAAGLSVAYTAIGFGKKVLLIEKYKPGGECTWSGCVPSKALINIAKDIYTVKKYNEDFQIDTKEVLKNIQRVILNVYSHETPEKLINDGINYLNGKAKIKDKNSVIVNGKEYKTKNIVISTGSSPFIPPIEGIEKVDYLTNETLFYLEKLPKSIIILGGGAIGIEMAQALNRIGVKVQLVEMMESILIKEDREFAQIIKKELENEGVKIYEKTEAIKVIEKHNKKILTVKNMDKQFELEGEALLVAVGRKANIEDLGIEEIGVETTRRGIVVNKKLQTTIKNIYAVGDVVGPYQFSHMANVQGILAAKNIVLPIKQNINYSHVAWTTFTSPELATAGMSLEEIKKQNIKYREYQFDFKNIDRAMTKKGDIGKVKLFLDKKGYVLGATIIGERAGEIISEIQVLKTLKINYAKLVNVIHPYPTYSEVLNKISKKVAVDNILENPIVKFFMNFKK